LNGAVNGPYSKMRRNHERTVWAALSWSSVPCGAGNRPSVGVTSRSWRVKNRPIGRVTRCWASTAAITSSAVAASVSASTCRDTASISDRSGRRGAASTAAPVAIVPSIAASTIASGSSSGLASVTEWPNHSSTLPAVSVAVATCGSTATPDHGRVVTATRSRPGAVRISSEYGRAGGGAAYLSPTGGAATQSSSSAVSRTVLASPNSTINPKPASPA